MRRRRLLVWAFLLPTAYCLLPTTYSAAAPSQQDVFKSIHDSVDETTNFDSRPMILLLAGGAGVVVLLVVMNKRQSRGPAPKTFNHPGKLAREVMRQVPLNATELRQLKLLAEASRQTDAGEINNSLTLLLCPSALGKAVQSKPAKIDRQALAQVVRKLARAKTKQ